MKAQILQLISEGKLEKAIELLLQLTEQLPDKDLYNEVTHHSSVFARISKTQRLGTESTAEQNIAYAKMNQALLGVVKNLPEDASANFIPSIGQKGKSSTRIIIILLGILVLALLSYFLYQSFFAKETEVYKCKERVCRDCKDCYNSGCFEEAYRCLNALKQLSPEEEKLIQAAIAIRDGDKSLVDGQFIKAKEFYLRAIELDKGIEIHRAAAIQGITSTQKADSLLSEGRLDEARASYQQSLRSKNSTIAKYVQIKLAEIDEREKTRRVPGKGALPAILEGKWNQSKSGKAGEIKGEIDFDYSENAEAPKILYQNHFANGVVQKGELVNLTYDANKQSFQGVWHNFFTKRKGAFYFEVDTLNKRLSGTYSLQISESPSYYWNGKKQ